MSLLTAATRQMRLVEALTFSREVEKKGTQVLDVLLKQQRKSGLVENETAESFCFLSLFEETQTKKPKSGQQVLGELLPKGEMGELGAKKTTEEVSLLRWC